MDRLPALIACCALVLHACDKPEPRASGAVSRVDAVMATTQDKPDAKAFCDVFHRPETAPSFELPELAAPEEAHPKTGWRWYNLWATWCKPCIAEIPTLQRWHEGFRRGGKNLELVFLSVDESSVELDAFRTKYPGTPQTLRVKDAGGVPTWFQSVGLEEGAAIPIHVFVSNGRLRCVRTGALEPNHHDAISALLGS